MTLYSRKRGVVAKNIIVFQQGHFKWENMSITVHQ